jgi:hypothetical protein
MIPQAAQPAGNANIFMAESRSVRRWQLEGQGPYNGSEGCHAST